jgi:hypothetical protein
MKKIVLVLTVLLALVLPLTAHAQWADPGGTWGSPLPELVVAIDIQPSAPAVTDTPAVEAPTEITVEIVEAPPVVEVVPPVVLPAPIVELPRPAVPEPPIIEVTRPAIPTPPAPQPRPAVPCNPYRGPC